MKMNEDNEDEDKSASECTQTTNHHQTADAQCWRPTIEHLAVKEPDVSFSRRPDRSISSSPVLHVSSIHSDSMVLILISQQSVLYTQRNFAVTEASEK